MSVAELKEALHRVIDKLEKKEQLESIFSFINSQYRSDVLSEEEIKILEERHAGYLKGEEETVTVDELKAHMRKKYGF